MPLTPAAPEFEDLMKTAPLDVAVPSPETTTIEPPVPAEPTPPENEA